MITYKELIRNADKELDDPNLGRLFMVELMREKGQDLFLVHDDIANPEIAKEYENGVKQLTEGKPLSYILGYHWFYGYKILVNENTLIPRSETEELVSHILAYVDDHFEKPQVVDVATGSGAIAIALSKELNLEVDASDISEEALNLASKSAEYNDAKVTFYGGDMLEPIIALDKKYDVLVCNPPYIKEIEDVDPSVLDFEPHIALFGGDDGLYFYRKVFEKAHLVLKETFLMAFEIGYDLGESITELAKAYFPDANIEIIKDISGLDRMLLVYKK